MHPFGLSGGKIDFSLCLSYALPRIQKERNMKLRRGAVAAIGGISLLFFLNACASHSVLRADIERREYTARGETVDPSQIFQPEIPAGSESSKEVERSDAPSAKAPELPPRQKSGELLLPAPKREEPKISHEPKRAVPPPHFMLGSPESASRRTAIPQQKPKVPTKKSVTVAAAPKKDCPCEITVTAPLPTVIDKTTIVPQSRDPVIRWLLLLLAMGGFGVLIVLSLILREMQRQNNPVNNPRRPPPRV